MPTRSETVGQRQQVRPAESPLTRPVTVLWPKHGANVRAAMPGTRRPTTESETASSPRTLAEIVSRELAPSPAASRVGETQDAWDWTVAMYLYLVGLGCGSFVVAVVLDWSGQSTYRATVELLPGWPWAWSQLFVWWGPAAAAVGALFVLLHLGSHWLLFPTTWRNWRVAWMARGFLLLVLFVAVGLAVAAVTILIPEWPPRIPVIWLALQGTGLLLALGTLAYTGILLWSKTCIPAWANWRLPPLVVASAIACGLAASLLGILAVDVISSGDTEAGSVVTVVGTSILLAIVIEAVLLTLYLRSLESGGPPARASAEMLVRGTHRRAFWIPVVGGGLVLSAILTATALATGASVCAALAAGGVLIGGYYLRLAILQTGIRQAPPLCTLSDWRADLTAEPNQIPPLSASLPLRAGACR